MLRGVGGQLTITLISSPLLWAAGYAEDIYVGLNQGQAYKSLSCSAWSICKHAVLASGAYQVIVLIFTH